MFLKGDVNADVDVISLTFAAILRLLSSLRMTSAPCVKVLWVVLSRLTHFQKPLTRPFRNECATGMRKKVEALHSEHLVMVCFVDNSETNSVKHESMHA